jgi:hypothetical protein
MSSEFGPWSTAIDSGGEMRLSRFWKRRLMSLAAISERPAAIGGGGLGLIVAGFLIALIPTLRAQGPAASAIPPAAAAPDSVRDNAQPIDARLNDDQAKDAQPASAKPAGETAADRQQPDEVVRAVNYLSGLQQGDGAFRTGGADSQFVVGTTALTLMALLRSGMPADDPQIANGLAFLRKQESAYTYEISLQTLALCAAKSKEDAPLIQRNVKLLEASQIEQGPNGGGWSYSANLRQLGGGDGSNSEFAIWAIDEAARYGAKVGARTWHSAARYWKERQNEDGSWSYSGPSAQRGGTGSMTASGVASLAICLERLKAFGFKPDESDQAVVDRGVEWLSKNFSATSNPGDGRWFLYYAIVLRRACEVARREKLGDHDWRADLSATVLKGQDPETGGWTRSAGDAMQGPLLGTASALLFLAEPAANRK